jgi:intergrase/recombinase
LEELVQQPPPPLLNNMVPSYNAIRHACRKRGINMDMRFCRKIHGSWLHQHGLTAEEVDFLQGRSSISVFSRHYLTPNSSLKDRVIAAALEKLKQEIEQ